MDTGINSAGREFLGSPAARQEPESAPDPYKIVSIRLRSAEFKTFSEQATAHGLTSNQALRIAARRIGGFLEIDRDMRRHLEKIVQSIGEISGNIRSLSRSYAESGKVDLRDLATQRIAFGLEFAQLDALLRSVLNTSQRRSDGCRMLEDAMK